MRRATPNLVSPRPPRRAARAPRAALSAALSLTLAAVSGCGPTSLLITPVPADRGLVEHEVSRESFWARDKVLLLDLDGVITSTSRPSILGLPPQNPVSVFKEKLDKAGRDRRMRAVVLRINSPGGGVTASDLMYTELRRFKEETELPVVAVLMDTAASGGYYVACAADRIVAHPTTVTGSIGVIMVTPDLSGAMSKIGVRANIIKSGPMKDAGSPFRAMSETDRAVFQAMIDNMYERFLAVVAAGRPHLEAAQVRQLADGRVFLGPQARADGLVDELGTVQDAIRVAKEAAGLDDTPVVVVAYARSIDHRPNVYAERPPGAPSVQLVNIELPDWLRDPAPQFLYLWAPGW